MKKNNGIFRKLLAGIILLTCASLSLQVKAAVSLGSTRIIYHADQKQVQLPVINNDEKSTFLIQSWVENSDGQKDGRFVITPPLFSIQGKKENTLRIIDATNNQLPHDRESLFWLNVKAIPAMDKSKMSENILQLAIINRIKLYYRPSGLSIAPEKMAESLRFRRIARQLVITNPTPYYVTVTELTVGTSKINNALVPPFGETKVVLPSNAGSQITYRTINDYGALTPKMNGQNQ